VFASNLDVMCTPSKHDGEMMLTLFFAAADGYGSPARSGSSISRWRNSPAPISKATMDPNQDMSKPLVPDGLSGLVHRFNDVVAQGRQREERSADDSRVPAGDAPTSRNDGNAAHETVSAAAQSYGEKANTPRARPVTRAMLLASVDGDLDLLRKLVTLFLEDSPMWRAQLRTALDQRDAQLLMRAAHRLRGSIGVFVTEGAFEWAGRLEADGRDADLDAAIDHVVEFDKALEELLAAMAAVAAESAA
jgi:HPt (histidine-containing phosphotransfer) domain-containing protein